MYRKIEFTYEEVMEILKELEVISVSYDKIGAYFHDYEDRELARQYADEVIRFEDTNKICNRISKVKYYISSRFYDTYSDEIIEESYDEFDKLKYWEKPGDNLLEYKDIEYD